MSIEEFQKKCENQRKTQKKIVLDYKRKGITTYLLILFISDDSADNCEFEYVVGSRDRFQTNRGAVIDYWESGVYFSPSEFDEAYKFFQKKIRS